MSGRGSSWVDDLSAVRFLESRGYGEHPTERWCWIHSEAGRDPTALEVDAILYLRDEYDYGGLYATEDPS